MSQIEDPRSPSFNLIHPLTTIFFITVVCSLCGSNDWETIVIQAKTIELGADYVLPVKENQAELLEEVLFRAAQEVEFRAHCERSLNGVVFLNHLRRRSRKVSIFLSLSLREHLTCIFFCASVYVLLPPVIRLFFCFFVIAFFLPGGLRGMALPSKAISFPQPRRSP